MRFYLKKTGWLYQEQLSLSEKCIIPHRSHSKNFTKYKNSSLPKDYNSPAEVGGRNDALTKHTGSLLGKGFSVEEIHYETTKWNNTNSSPLSEEERINTVESIIRTNDRENVLKNYYWNKW